MQILVIFQVWKFASKGFLKWARPMQVLWSGHVIHSLIHDWCTHDRQRKRGREWKFSDPANGPSFTGCCNCNFLYLLCAEFKFKIYLIRNPNSNFTEVHSQNDYCTTYYECLDWWSIHPESYGCVGLVTLVLKIQLVSNIEVILPSIWTFKGIRIWKKSRRF